MRRAAVFARPPIEGEVKTRLSPALPPALARDLYAAMLQDTLAAVQAARADERVVFWAGDPARAGFALPPGWIERRQEGGSLGARLAGAFETLLAPPCKAAVIVGADCPDLEAADLDRAFAALDAADLAIGPAADGGYGLIGLRRPAPGLFEGIDWSTPAVLEQTRARAAAAGLETVLLPALDDIDTPADLARWIGGQVAVETGRAPHTRAALERMGLMPMRTRPG
jgi:rSAM/selenodomain-associated transferase 1